MTTPATLLARLPASRQVAPAALVLATAIGLGVVVVRSSPPLVLGGVAIALYVAVALNTRWGLAISVLPALYVPAPAMYVTAVGPLSLSMLIAIAAVGAPVLTMLQRRTLTDVSPAALAAIAVLCMTALAGATLAGRSALQSTLVLTLMWIGAFLGGAVYGSDRRQIGRLLLAATPIALLALFEATSGSNPFLTFLGDVRFSTDQASGLHRSLATFGHPLVAGAMFAALAMLSLTTQLRSGWVLAMLFFAASATTVSRSAAIGIAVAVVVFLLQQRAQRGRVIAVIAVAIAGAVIAASQLTLVRDSFENRVLSASYAQTARTNGLDVLKDDVLYRPTTILFGDGFRSTQQELHDRGGNAGVSTYDDQVVTLVYDVGLLATALGLLIGAFAVLRGSVVARRVAAPPLAGLAAMLLFFDGLYWFSTAALFFILYGIATQVEPPAERASA